MCLDYCAVLNRQESWLQVFYKVTEFMDDQILMTGFAPGGLSQAPQSFFRTASLSAPLAQEQGIFGIKPEVFLHASYALGLTAVRILCSAGPRPSCAALLGQSYRNTWQAAGPVR